MSISVRLEEYGGAPSADVLLRVVSGTIPADPLHERTVYTGMRSLPGGVVVEDWVSSAASMVHGRDQALHYAHNGEACFGWLYVKASSPVGAATQVAYANAFRVFNKLGFAYLLRAWHYLPDIHGQEDGGSRYACFCRGRVAAFEAVGVQNYCAATVIGTRSDFGVMYFLAAAEPGAMIENPRQTSAWYYPLLAVRAHPLFARAVHKRWKEQAQLYVSGTASIVGHESRHPGDTVAQLREALLNLRVLLDASSDFAGANHLSCLKAYIKCAGDEGAVRGALAASPFTFGSTALFEGEVCRPELRVEIEVLTA